MIPAKTGLSRPTKWRFSNGRWLPSISVTVLRIIFWTKSNCHGDKKKSFLEVPTVSRFADQIVTNCGLNGDKICIWRHRVLMLNFYSNAIRQSFLLCLSCRFHVLPLHNYYPLSLNIQEQFIFCAAEPIVIRLFLTISLFYWPKLCVSM